MKKLSLVDDEKLYKLQSRYLSMVNGSIVGIPLVYALLKDYIYLVSILHRHNIIEEKHIRDLLENNDEFILLYNELTKLITEIEELKAK